VIFAFCFLSLQFLPQLQRLFLAVKGVVDRNKAAGVIVVGFVIITSIVTIFVLVVAGVVGVVVGAVGGGVVNKDGVGKG